MTKKPSSQAPMADAKAPFEFESQDIPVARLLLDPNNYRFFDRKKFKKKAANRAHEESVQRATLEALEQAYQLDELKHSILTNGYVPMERIIVVPYSAKTGFFLVVEGNRRVASLKSLLKEEQEGVRVLSPTQKTSFSKIPCAVLKSSGMSLKHAERVIMGIRHIAGPKEWGAYQQALLVSELKNDEGLDFKEIGEMLGISSVEAARRYRAIGALQQMSTEQKRGRQDPEVQIRQLRSFAATQGWKVTAEYVDRETGAKAERTQFQGMMNDAAKRAFDVLLFWSVDRFSREGVLPVLTHMKRLSDYGIKYRSFEEPYIDTTHEFGDLLAAFAAKLAELERKRIRARVKAGLEVARAKGKTLGRPRVVVDRAKVWALKDAGRSIRDIANMMNLSHGTVQRALAAR
jgi:DNA invertase Pin-like site-specific DNA recombinase